MSKLQMEQPNLPTTRLREKRLLLPLCLVVSAVMLAVCSKASPLYPLNDWVDVNIYCTIGRGMFAGRVPYLDLYDQKGPVVYLVYGLFSLLSGRGYFGVWLLEVLCFAAFLYNAYRLLSLYTKSAILALPVLAGLILPAMSISHGGSLEEICLPVFGYGLYTTVAYFKNVYPQRPGMKMIFCNGLLAGLLLFAKFNLLAFYFAWMAWMAITRFYQRDWKYGLACCGVFLGAMALTGVPWVIYFAQNGALPEFGYYYFYSNMFGYSYLEPPVLPNMLLAILKGTGASMLRNLQYTLLIGLGLGWITYLRQVGAKTVEKVNLWLLIAFMAAGAFMGGQGYRYYGIPLAVFATLGLAPLLRLWDRQVAPHIPVKTWAQASILAGLTVIGLGASLLTSSNTYLIGTPKLETPQYRFAAVMENERREDTITLLCRAFPDSGFYRAAGVIPACRFFTSTNVPLQEIADEQVRQVEAGIPEFVVMRDREDAPAAGYRRIDEASLLYEDEIRTYYLYQRAE